MTLALCMCPHTAIYLARWIAQGDSLCPIYMCPRHVSSYSYNSSAVFLASSFCLISSNLIILYI